MCSNAIFAAEAFHPATLLELRTLFVPSSGCVLFSVNLCILLAAVYPWTPPLAALP